MEQRPSCFAVALPAVGVMDMLLITSSPAARHGHRVRVRDDPKAFAYLFNLAAHNLKAGTCYPRRASPTADHDDRVVPSHSFKFAATLRRLRGAR